MKKYQRHLFRLMSVVFLTVIFIAFFNGLAEKGPSRKKFKVLEGGSEDLIKPEAAPEVNYLKEIAGNKHLKEWMGFWQKCVPGLSVDSMESLGQFPIDNEPTDFDMSQKVKNGPGGQFYTGAPGGSKSINPYWGRLTYKPEGNEWSPYIEHQCGAELFDSSQKKSSIILRCYMHDGLDGAFWLDKNRVVVVGYDAITRQMSVECETVESCIAPSVWIVDLKSATLTQYRGNVVKRDACSLDAYLKLKVPKFYNEK